jgi:hypothetical protein
MSVTPSPIGGFAGQFFNNNGQPLSGGKIYTYAAGGTTPQATYTSALGIQPHSNPIVLDSAGRVPGGEIWLTDGLVYKFVIETSTGGLIGTYDNITGVNSNFVNYTVQEEVITATAGQTVFNLSTINYTPGTNSLSVYIDGVNQYVGDSYIETDSDTVTFTAGLHVGAEVKFTTAVQTTTGAIDAGIVGYTAGFTGAVGQTVQTKLEQYVSVKDFGAVGDGVANDTAEIAAALTSTATTGDTLSLLNGVYLSDQQTRTVGSSFVGYGAGQTTVEANTGVPGPMFNMTYSTSFFYGEVGGMTIDMTASPTRQALFMNDVHRTLVQNIATTSGAGIKIAAGGDMRLSNIFATNPTVYGIVFDGDIGSEQYVNTSLVRVDDAGVTLTAGYAVERTTSTDTGGFYFQDTRVTRGAGTIHNGYLFEGTNATAPSLFAFLNRTVADNINGTGACYNFIKVKDCFLSGGFGRGTATGGAVRLEGTQDIYITGNDLDNGAAGKLINFVGTEVRPMSLGNKLVQGTAYHFGASSAVTGFVFDDVFTSGVTLTNDGTKLANSMTEHQYRSALNVVTHPSGGAVGCFNLYDPINANRVHMRNSNGVFQLLNSGFNLIFSVDNGGTLDLFNGVAVGGTQVIAAQQPAVANATGSGDVVAQLNSLLSRLRAHGLIAT